ncbi:MULTISPECIES: hypothetical protein [Bacteroides]|uniref:hypothetical protein n=1 Tax=Bacteroides TaxID=816 RepID=UPI00351C6071
MDFPWRITDTCFCTEVLRLSVVGIFPGMTAVIIGRNVQIVCKEGLDFFQYGIQGILVCLLYLVGCSRSSGIYAMSCSRRPVLHKLFLLNSQRIYYWL